MKHKGFTLIELLVVIGIIALLVAVGIPNFLSARQRAADARKKADMQAVKNALRLYYNDYGKYPGGNGPTMTGCGESGTGSCPNTICGDFSAGSTSCDTMNLYMKRFPTGFLSSIFYYQKSSGEDFCLRAVLENYSDPDITTSQARCSASCGTSCSGTGRYCVCAD